MSELDLATALAAVLAASQLPAQLASRREMHPVLRFPVTVVDTPLASTMIAGKQDSEVRAHA